MGLEPDLDFPLPPRPLPSMEIGGLAGPAYAPPAATPGAAVAPGEPPVPFAPPALASIAVALEPRGEPEPASEGRRERDTIAPEVVTREGSERRARIVKTVVYAVLGTLAAVTLAMVAVAVGRSKDGGGDRKTAAAPAAAPSSTAAPAQSAPRASAATAVGDRPAERESPPSTAAAPVAPASPGDEEAIHALEKLQASIIACAERLHQLPGTTATVPPSFAALKAGPYKPGYRDFSAPTFACGRFRIEQPMSFVLQWQFKRAERAGTGVAWIDDGGDGVADRAYAFTVKMDEKGVPVPSKVAPADAKTPFEHAPR